MDMIIDPHVSKFVEYESNTDILLIFYINNKNDNVLQYSSDFLGRFPYISKLQLLKYK